jgi:hypothetical protein
MERLLLKLLDGVGVGVLAVVGTVVAYLGFLGWDQKKDIGPDGGETGPYQPWQVIGLSIVLVALAIWAGRRDQPLVGAFVIPVALTIVWSLDASNDQDSDGLWAVGAMFLYVGSTLGLGLVGWLASQLRPRRRLSRSTDVPEALGRRTS